MQNTKTCFSRDEAANEISISVRKLDELIASMELEAFRLGRRVLITRRALEQFLVRIANR
jgi:excisionase family DNA binding protein